MKRKLISSSLEAGYLEASQDTEQKVEAAEWANALIGDVLDAQPS